MAAQLSAAWYRLEKNLESASFAGGIIRMEVALLRSPQGDKVQVDSGLVKQNNQNVTPRTVLSGPQIQRVLIAFLKIETKM